MTQDPRVEMVRSLRRRGLSLRSIGKKLGVSHELARRLAGPPPRRVTRGASLWVPLSREERTALAGIAADLGLRNSVGPHTGGGSITLLLDALARGEIIPTWTEARFENVWNAPSRVRLDAAPWVFARIEQQAKALGIRVEGSKRRQGRLIALLLRAVVQGAVALRWREGAGPETVPHDYREGQA